MKKLLLLLTLLLFFPAQSFAQFCPDGSVPTRAISADGSFYEFKCRGKQNTQKTSSSYGPMRLFDKGTSWLMSGNGRLMGNNGLSCWFLGYDFVGTCNNGVNYGYCNSYDNTELCGSDGTIYYSDSDTTLRSSFGSYCRVYNDASLSIIC
jgi:hypothetical protein